MHLVPTLLPSIDTEALKVADRLFKNYFPSFEDVRHAATHPAELFSDANKAAKNTPEGEFTTPLGTMRNEGGTIAIIGNFVNRTFMATIKKKVVTYDLDDVTLAKLNEVAELIYSAFQRASRFANSRAIAQRLK